MHQSTITAAASNWHKATDAQRLIAAVMGLTKLSTPFLRYDNDRLVIEAGQAIGGITISDERHFWTLKTAPAVKAFGAAIYVWERLDEMRDIAVRKVFADNGLAKDWYNHADQRERGHDLDERIGEIVPTVSAVFAEALRAQRVAA